MQIHTCMHTQTDRRVFNSLWSNKGNKLGVNLYQIDEASGKRYNVP